jgi:hypothetical protein
MSDDWNNELDGLINESYHDAYIQRIIDRIEDPDYEDFPLLVDTKVLFAPPGTKLRYLLSALENVIEVVWKL